MALRYTTVQEFWKFMGYNESVLDFQPGNEPCKETVASSPVTAGDYYLDQRGVNEDTLVLYAGSTALTLTTDYTFDSDTSKVTITSDGATALSGEDLKADYEYCQLGKDLDYNETTRLLERAENKIHDEIGNVFANQSATDPAYLKIVNEKKKGGGLKYVHYPTDYYPVIKLQTTTNGAYTTGGTEITLTDASGFPSTGTIYVGGNKVTYTGKATNTLTVPSTTPSIDDDATVRGEVVEVDTSASGTTGSFLVLNPDTDYAIDYDTGEVQLQDTYYASSDSSILTENLGQPQFGVDNKYRHTYMTAWRNPGQDAFIPDNINELIYSIVGQKLQNRTIFKANTGQRDNFSPGVINQMRDFVESELRLYRCTPSSRN